MHWYVNANGQMFGPAEEAQVVAWIRSGTLVGGLVCAVGSQQWVDLTAHPPFAAALFHAAPPPPLPTAGVGYAQPVQARAAPQAMKKPMNPWLKLVLFVFGLVIVSFRFGVVGVVLGVGMIGLAEYARRSGRASFVSWTLRKPPSKGQSVASLAIGGILLIGGGANVIGSYWAERETEKAFEARKEIETKRRSDLVAQIPQTVAAWRTRLAQVKAMAEATEYVGGGLALADAVTTSATQMAADVGNAAPPELAQIKSEAATVRAKYGARTDFEQAVRSVGEQFQAAKDQATAHKYLAADEACTTALAGLDAIGAADASLLGFLPAGFDRAAQQKAIGAFRTQIATPVAGEKRKQDNEARLGRVASIKAMAKSDERASYVQAKAQLADEAKACGGCAAASAIATAARQIDATLQDWPIDIATLTEMKNRYADLRGHRVRVKGALGASTYYNCIYGSQGDWRSMELSQLLGGDIHVYCSRGDSGCEAIFSRLASGSNEKGSAIVKYPPYNDVCSEDQAFLVEWDRD